MLSRILGSDLGSVRRIGSVRLDPEHSGFIRLDQDFELLNSKWNRNQKSQQEIDWYLTVQKTRHNHLESVEINNLEMFELLANSRMNKLEPKDPIG